MDEREVGLQCGLDQIALSVDIDLPLPLLDNGANSRGSEDTAKSATSGSYPLDESALRHQIDDHFAGNHLLLGIGIEPDMARDCLADQPCSHELTDAPHRGSRVIGDDDQVALFLAHELIDDAFGSSRTHEASNHETCPIGDHGDGIFDRYCLHS